jgi:hypothetical protein
MSAGLPAIPPATPAADDAINSLVMPGFFPSVRRRIRRFSIELRGQRTWFFPQRCQYRRIGPEAGRRVCASRVRRPKERRARADTQVI